MGTSPVFMFFITVVHVRNVSDNIRNLLVTTLASSILLQKLDSCVHLWKKRTTSYSNLLISFDFPNMTHSEILRESPSKGRYPSHLFAWLIVILAPSNGVCVYAGGLCVPGRRW